MVYEVKCAECRFVCENKAISKKNWTAYRCNNRRSEFYKTTLNISIGGAEMDTITWIGCEFGERQDTK